MTPPVSRATLRAPPSRLTAVSRQALRRPGAPPPAPVPVPVPGAPPRSPGMAPRLQLEKAAWRWAETVPPEAVAQEHVEAAYRIALPPCQRGACRSVRGCSAPPRPALWVRTRARPGAVRGAAAGAPGVGRGR